MDVLVVDIGGTHVKIFATGQDERQQFESGPKLTPQSMVANVKKNAVFAVPKKSSPHASQKTRFVEKDTMKGAAA